MVDLLHRSAGGVLLLVNPSVVGTARATLPALVREMAESQIDMTPECLVGWRVFIIVII